MESFQKYFVYQKEQSAFKILAISWNKLQMPSLEKRDQKRSLLLWFLWFFLKFPFDLFDLKKNKIMHQLLQNQKTFSHKNEVQKMYFLYGICILYVNFLFQSFFLSIM